VDVILRQPPAMRPKTARSSGVANGGGHDLRRGAGQARRPRKIVGNSTCGNGENGQQFVGDRASERKSRSSAAWVAGRDGG